MEIELYVSDLDGTLLNKYHRSDDFIDETIDQVLEQNKYFAIATGRHLHGNHRIGLTFLNRPIYKICMNGALIYDPNDCVVSQTTIPSHIVQKLLKQFPEVSFEWITQDGVYVQLSKWQHFWKMISGNLTGRHVAKHLIALIKGAYHYNVQDIPIDGVLKIDTCIANDTVRQELREFLKNYQDEIMDAGYRHDIFEMTATSANKKEAVELLVNKLQLRDDQVAVYGNDLNDVSMLQNFQNSYVPKEAVEKAQQVANHVLGSSKQHAIAKHIRQNLKKI